MIALRSKSSSLHRSLSICQVRFGHVAEFAVLRKRCDSLCNDPGQQSKGSWHNVSDDIRDFTITNTSRAESAGLFKARGTRSTFATMWPWPGMSCRAMKLKECGTGTVSDSSCCCLILKQFLKVTVLGAIAAQSRTSAISDLHNKKTCDDQHVNWNAKQPYPPFPQ